jgi:hypothetical protein
VRTKLATVVGLGMLSFVRVAHAGEAADGELTAEPQAAPRPWLYVDDATIPRPLSAVAQTRVTYTQAAPSARPFAFDIGHRGVVVEGGGEVSLLPWLALTATGYGAGADGTVGAVGGVRIALLPAGGSTHVVVGSGAMRDLSGAAGVWGSAAFEQDAGRARVGATLRVVHAFAGGRDALDTNASAGASYRVAGPLRAGVEWVGQDLEGAVDHDEAEGGMRHFAGPSASVELLERRLSMVVGPAFALSHGAPPVLGRMSIAYAF